eukprot:CAMPEP_0180555618 /NCGR_PEP_ID=MMETSP1037_2-20121125/77_1 /TAXON_ID=632150 /ORGANISM="Azadinium spinosum, Strain 3D9" /LENGTH=169 /DNA_ID=CAMNT_0022571471 /DNA_START=35 /DNA_END=541 /DNA_ORIENTATION=-
MPIPASIQCPMTASVAVGDMATDQHHRARASDVDASSRLCATLRTALEEGLMTYMMRYMPRNIREDGIMAELDSHGLKDHYNFICLPRESKRNRNMGYAFVNFVSPESAWLAATVLYGQRWKTWLSDKLIVLAPARVQGLAQSLAECERFREPDSDGSNAHSPLVVHNR